MDDLSHIATEQPIDVEALRLRLAKMTNAELRKFGEARDSCAHPARILASRRANHSSFNSMKHCAEWRRRHPKPASA
jgi:hypothetical protein